MKPAASQVQHNLPRAKADKSERTAHVVWDVAAVGRVTESQLAIAIVTAARIRISSVALALALALAHGQRAEDTIVCHVNECKTSEEGSSETYPQHLIPPDNVAQV